MSRGSDTWSDRSDGYERWRDPAHDPVAYWWPVAVTAALAVAANIFAIAQIWPPFIGAAVGFWLILLHPVYLLATTSIWGRHAAIERLGYSLAAVLLTLMLAGLAVNSVLPLFTSLPPLSRVPVAVLADIINLALYFLRRRYPADFSWRDHFRAMQPQEKRLIGFSLLSVGLAVTGANRLNNGAGDLVALAAIGAVLLVILLQFRWMDALRDEFIGISIYLTSLALLLTTSLRGWFITGHDIQNEYRVFQLTAIHGQWSMSYWHNAYNACLSITILPTILSNMVGVAHPYVFKFFFQLIFAFCPVMVYAIVGRYWLRQVSILAVIYFIGFPTFFNDMPYLNRQETAFIFVCVAILAATNARWNLALRRVVFVGAGVGVEVAHYSTMYVLLGALTIGWVSRQVFGLLSRAFGGKRGDGSPSVRWATGAVRTTTISTLIILGAVFFTWGGLATRTSGQILTTASSTVSALLNGSGAGGSGSFYSIFTRKAFNPESALLNYRDSALAERANAPGERYLPLLAVSRARTPVVDQNPVRPLTTAGRVLSAIGIPVATLNLALRALTAYAEQLFVVIGLAGLLLTARLRRVIGEELFWLAAGSTVMTALITALPGASTEYGPLRAYQQGLITMAPVLVVGTGTCLRWFTRRALPVAAVGVVCLAFFITTTSLLPQLVGGNVAELNLNNSGTYYHLYYVHEQDLAAVGWLSDQHDVLGPGVRASYTESRFQFTNAPDTGRQAVDGRQVVGDIYPTLIGRSSWLMINYTMIHQGIAATRVSNHVIQYRYPLWLLRSNKNLVYNNGGAEIFR